MKDIDVPSKIPTPWASAASGAYRNPIPAISQIGINDGYASWPDGFPPDNFDPSGVPFRGQDVNGVLNEVSAGLRWLQAAGLFAYDPTYATTIGGYPGGAVIVSRRYRGLLWQNTLNDNLSDPDAGGAGWFPFNRLRLTGNWTITVDPAGNDGNTGLSEADPFQHISRALWLIENFLDISGFVVTVRIKPGTYTNDPIVMNGRPPGTGGGVANIIFQAIDGTVNLVTTTQQAPVLAAAGAAFTLYGDGYNISCPTGDGAIVAGISSTGCTILIDGNPVYSGCRDADVYAGPAGFINYGEGVVETIAADAPRHFWANNGTINGAGNAALDGISGVLSGGARNFSTAFASTTAHGWINMPNYTFTGTGTGVRAAADTLGLIQIDPGGSATTFPGNAAVILANGGQYVAVA